MNVAEKDKQDPVWLSGEGQLSWAERARHLRLAHQPVATLSVRLCTSHGPQQPSLPSSGLLTTEFLWQPRQEVVVRAIRLYVGYETWVSLGFRLTLHHTGDVSLHWVPREPHAWPEIRVAILGRGTLPARALGC